ncbi:MAG: 50S ribosomal protein L25 [Clostridiales bacterium]|nr:50S ribosomal protein L25 [Clostridiales bacterium]
MGTVLLELLERKESAKKTRKNGYVPAVIYGRGFENGKPVKIEASKLAKALKGQGATPRFSAMVNKEETEVLVKEVQKDAITGQILHVDMQALTGDEHVRVKVPVILTGREALERNNLILETYISEVEISGPANILPESLSIDVSNMNAGDTITVRNIKLTVTDVRIHTAEDEVLAVVSVPKQARQAGEDSDENDEGSQAAE